MATFIRTQGGGQANTKIVGDGSTAKEEYKILGATSDAEAAALLRASVPLYAQTLDGRQLVLDSMTLKHIECEHYEASADFVDPESQNNGGGEGQSPDAPEVSFDTTGESIHITQSLRTVRSYPPGNEAKHKGAIGVEKDEKGRIKVNGTTVYIPKLTMQLTAHIPPPADPFELARRLARGTAKVNAQAWRGFEPGELLMMGARLRGKTTEKWTYDVTIECSENIHVADGFMIGQHGPIEKGGHEHLWCEYQATVGYVPGQGDVKTIDCVGVYIEQIYFAADFGQFGLGN